MFSLLWCSTYAVAQVSPGPSSMPEQWQLTLDVIKAKAQTLLIKNNELHAEYRQLGQKVQDLNQALKDAKDKNEGMRLFLQERHGRTDQQAQLEALQQTVKTKKQQAAGLRKQLENLEKKQADLDRTIQLQKARLADIQRRPLDQQKQNPLPAASAVDRQLTDLRGQLEEAKKQEVILENKLSFLKSGGPSQSLNADIEGTLAWANQRKYDELKKRKDQLEDAIRTYEMRMDQLKSSGGLAALSWPVQKKKLIHEMVQKDARNNQLREKIKILREDVDILKDQVAKLERRVNFMQGKDKTPQS
jgi:predicted RNase H-like nuclease (RuvC/YqgF family)